MTKRSREQEEKEFLINAGCNIDRAIEAQELWKSLGDMASKALHHIEVEAFNKGLEEAIKVIEKHVGDEECEDHKLTFCPYKMIEEIRNKLRKD